MDAKSEFGLNYTEDFKVACTINYLRQEEVLQYFVNRVSFYAFNGGEMEAVALWATGIILDCKQITGAEVIPVNDKKIQRISLKYISLLSGLTGNTHLSTVDKMKESYYIMQEWEDEMNPYIDFPQTFQLDHEQFLELTFDFNLMCRMNGIHPQLALQYFIDHISLARQRALKRDQFTRDDASMSLFATMIRNKSMKQHKLPVQFEIHEKFSKQLLSLDESLLDEPDGNERLRAYREFYAKWYNSLKKSLN